MECWWSIPYFVAKGLELHNQHSIWKTGIIIIGLNNQQSGICYLQEKHEKVIDKNEMISKRGIMNTLIKDHWECEINVWKLDFKTRNVAWDKVRKLIMTKGLIFHDVRILHIYAITNKTEVMRTKIWKSKKK